MRTVDRLIKDINEPYLILVGAKLHSLLVVIVDEGGKTLGNLTQIQREKRLDNLTQLQRFSDMINLDISARDMVTRYRRAQLGL